VPGAGLDLVLIGAAGDAAAVEDSATGA
jgi:hypothetical protein